MGQIKITGPDGRSLALNAPDGASEDQIMAKINEIKANWGSIPHPDTVQTTATGAFLTGVGQAAFGFGDEIEAGARALYDKAVDGGPLGDAYDRNLDETRARVRASADQHPVAYYGGEIGGALAVPGGLARIGVRGAIHAAANQGIRAGVKAGAKEGAAYGAAYGFGKSEGGPQARLEGAAGGAAVGGAFGAAAPVVLSGMRGALEPVRNRYNSVFNPTEEAARRVALAQDADNQAIQSAYNTLGPNRNDVLGAEAQQMINAGRAGGELRNIDTMGGGESVRGLARSAANNSPQAREILNQMTDERFTGQGDRFLDFIRNGIGLRFPGNAEVAREALKAAARKSNRPAYMQAFREGDGPIMTSEMERLTGAPIVRQAMQDAAESGKNTAIREGYGAFNTRVDITGDGQVRFLKGKEGVPTYPNLQFWDEVKRNLDTIAKKAFRAGDNKVGGEAADFARTLRTELDSVVPSYANTRSQAMQFFQADDALEAGQNLYRGVGGMNLNAAERAVAKMSPPERRMLAEGYTSELIDAVRKAPDRRSILTNFAKSDDARQRMVLAVGPRRAREVEAFLYIEGVMDRARYAVQGNSTTARQLAELGLAGGSGLIASGGNPFDPSAWITGALMYGATRGRAHVQQNMATRIAEMLVSQNPVQVQNATQRIAQSPALLNNLRRAIAAGAAVSGGAMAQSGVPQQGLEAQQNIPLIAP